MESSATIAAIHARQILDARGNPTIEVDVITQSGHLGRASIPSGASTGQHEAVELRDGDQHFYLGRGVQTAIHNVHSIISPAITGCSVLNQAEIDATMNELDGTDNKSNLGANAILGVSLAVAQAAAKVSHVPLHHYLGNGGGTLLPMPFMNILNGGCHADNVVDIQEFMIVPVGAEKFSQAIQIGVEVYHHLKALLKSKGHSTNVGDEGGFAPQLSSDEEGIQFILEAIQRAGYQPGTDVAIALDAASSELYDPDRMIYTLQNSGRKLSSTEMVDFWKDWVDKYPIVSIEDGMAEDDWEGWQNLTHTLGDTIQLVGDDLFATHVDRLLKGSEIKAANAVLVKMNQVGTLSETIKTIDTAKSNHFGTIISHRSGETEDTFLADLSVALNIGQIKTGAPSRSDRVAKYNQLIRIEEYLKEKATFSNPLR